MKKLILTFLIAALLVFAGDWEFETVTFSTEATTSFTDSLEVDTTDTYDVGNGKKLPESYTLTIRLDTDTGDVSDDSLHLAIYADYSNDQSLYYSDSIGEIDLDSANFELADTVAKISNISVSSIPDYRYVRFRFLNMTADTFEVEAVQKSMEFE